MRNYSYEISGASNSKLHNWILDVDSIKGCESGLQLDPAGCYGACYACKIAKFRGIDFSKSQKRYYSNQSQVNALRNKAKKCKIIRVGTMGDPSEDWTHTLRVLNTLKGCNKPIVIITKHWKVMSEEQMLKLKELGVVLNTSISALDTQEQQDHRLEQWNRYKTKGGRSILRIVSCDFLDTKKAQNQKVLFTLAGELSLDNPLRVTNGHKLVKNGIIRVTKFSGTLMISLHNKNTYLGRCNECPDQCGILRNKNEGLEQ